MDLGQTATHWPIVERSALSERIRADLLRLPVRAQLLIGPPGVGKTVLSQQVIRDVADRSVVSVIALRELSGVPLGAFLPALVGLGVAADRIDSDPGSTIASLLGVVGRNADRFVLVVDDAPRLDDLSASAVYQLVRAFGVSLMATARLGEALPGPLTQLLDQGLAHEHRVFGLDIDEIDLLLERRFCGRARHADVLRLAARTEGNPYYLRVLVEAAERDGGVTRTDEVFRVRESTTTPNLPASIREALDRTPAQERAILHLVALTQPADPDLLGFTLVERATAASLRARGLLTTESGSPTLRVSHPLVTETIRNDPSLRPQVAAIAGRLGATGDSGHRFASIRLLWDAGLPVSAEALAWAADRAFAIGDLHVAALFADAVIASSPDPALRFRAAIVQGASASISGDLDSADAAFDVARAHARHPTEFAIHAARRGEHLAFRRNDVAAAVHLVAEVQRSMPPDVSGTLDGDLRMWRAVLGQMHDRAIDVSSFVAHPELAVRGAMALIMTESMNGRTDAAREAARVLSAVQDRLGVLDPAAAAMIGMETYFDLLSRGLHEQAVDFADARRMTAGDGVGLWTCTVAEHRSYNGRLTEAARLASLAVDQCRWRDVAGMLPLALALQADTTAKSGDHAGARAAIDAMSPAQRAEPKAAILVAECEAWMAFQRGEADRAATLVLEASQAAAGVGFRLVAAISLGLCIRFGAVSVAADQLTELCEDVPPDFALYTALRDLAVGLRDERPDAVPIPAARLATAGMAPTALDAISLACRMGPRPETRRRLDLVTMAVSHGIDAPLLQTRRAAIISDRERQVAFAAAGRERSREIAERLGVSVRTIDNHLHAVYRKLGVRSRDELREALEEMELIAPGWAVS